MNPASRCCPPCGVCYVGDGAEDGGCCYKVGDVIRLTFDQKADVYPTIYNSFISSCANPPFGPQCCDPNDPTNCTTLQRCCYEVKCDDDAPRWVEYECVAVPSGLANVQRVYNGNCYCHPFYEFELNGNQSANMPAATLCNYPIRFRYLCSGCRKIDGTCAVPSDHRPDSNLPCGYVLPSGDYFEAATPAPGWEYDCAPTCTGPDCVNCIISGAGCDCTDLAGVGFHAGSSCNFCVKACDLAGGTYDPNCGTAVQENCGQCEDVVYRDLDKCDGALWCCYRYKCVPESYDCDDPDAGTCTFDHVSTIKLERVGDYGCTWNVDERRCCAGKNTTPPNLPACAAAYPGPGDTERQPCP